MRILFLSHYFPPEGNAPATRVFEMCRRWVRAGHHVTVITCAPNVPNGKVYAGYRNRLRQREDVEGIEVIRVWTYLAPNKGKVRRIVNYLSYFVCASFAGLFVQRPDVVIATSPQFFCGWAGVIVSRLRRLPFILEIRDIWPESIVTVGAMKKSRMVMFLERLERRLYASARHIVTVGEGYRRQLEARGVQPARISVITNGVDRTAPAPSQRDGPLLDRLGLKDGFVCSYIGTIGMASGLDVVLRAARNLKTSRRGDIRFLLVGDGAVRAELERVAKAEQLDNVIFAGLQSRTRLNAFFSISDACLVHLRKKELFETVLPSKLLEAMAMAKAVVLGVKGSAAELIRESGAGICIEPENENELIAAIERLAADRALAESMGASGRCYVLKHFDLDVLARNYLTVVEQTAKPA